MLLLGWGGGHSVKSGSRKDGVRAKGACLVALAQSRVGIFMGHFAIYTQRCGHSSLGNVIPAQFELRMRADGEVVAYTAWESRMAGLSRERVLARNFFADAAPCINNCLGAERFLEMVSVTTSIGVACAAGLTEVDQRLHGADLALYRAKAEGRNRVVCG